MSSPEDLKGEAQGQPPASTPAEPEPLPGDPSVHPDPPATSAENHPDSTPDSTEAAYTSGETTVSHTPNTDDSYNYYDYPDYETGGSSYSEAPVPVASSGSTPPTPPPPPTTEDEEDPDEEGMLRMSFLEHLEELRSRIIKALSGIGIAFALSLIFANELWKAVVAPAKSALLAIGAEPKLAQLTPMDAFTTIYVKLPMLASIFLASPWILWQVWSFIAPGLYKKERRYAAPFVISTAGLFVLGGLFAYFVAFRFGLEFLLGLGRDLDVKPVVSLVEYFDLFVNVTLGVGLVFELPVLIFFLTLLRIVSPSFLLDNARYAILIIVIIAAIVTPTPDVFNLMLFSVPMVFLFFVGVFASYLLVLKREGKKFPWAKALYIFAIFLIIILGALYFGITRYGLKVVPHWPFITK